MRPLAIVSVISDRRRRARHEAVAVVSQETRERLASIDRETGFVCEDLAVEAQQS